MSAIEIVRFTIAPADRAVFLAERPAAIMALRERFGGLRDASLAELEDGTWVDVVTWSTLAEAKDAAETMPSIPAAARWAAKITGVSEIVHGEVVA